MQNVLHARLRHFAEMLAVGLVIEHGGAGKIPRLYLMVKIEIFLIAGKIIRKFLLLAVFFQRKSEGRKPDIALSI